MRARPGSVCPTDKFPLKSSVGKSRAWEIVTKTSYFHLNQASYPFLPTQLLSCPYILLLRYNPASAIMIPDIILYTAHHCPWAYRAQIALRELGLPFKTVVIDITVPRTPEYLAINPRGLVPALVYDGHVLTESGLIVQFLVDAHPSHLLMSSAEPSGALQRFSISFFVETYFNKAHRFYDKVLYASGNNETLAANKYVDAIVQDVEPLLTEASPFFGGSARITLAEVRLRGRHPVTSMLTQLGSHGVIHSSHPFTSQVRGYTAKIHSYGS